MCGGQQFFQVLSGKSKAEFHRKPIDTLMRKSFKKLELCFPDMDRTKGPPLHTASRSRSWLTVFLAGFTFVLCTLIQTESWWAKIGFLLTLANFLHDNAVESSSPSCGLTLSRHPGDVVNSCLAPGPRLTGAKCSHQLPYSFMFPRKNKLCRELSVTVLFCQVQADRKSHKKGSHLC